jgi:hypothetical protein
MSGLKRRQGSLLRDRAAPPVNVGHQHAERTLTKAGPNKMRLAETRTGLGHTEKLRSV